MSDRVARGAVLFLLDLSLLPSSSTSHHKAFPSRNGHATDVYTLSLVVCKNKADASVYFEIVYHNCQFAESLLKVLSEVFEVFTYPS